MKVTERRAVRAQKTSRLSLIVIAVLSMAVIALTLYSVSGYIVPGHIVLPSKQISFSSINVGFNYTGFLSGYFSNQTLPNIVFNSTNNKFTFDVYITNDNPLHNVSVYAVKSLTDGIGVISENDSVILAPNQSEELALQMNNSLGEYGGELNLEIYTNSSPRITSPAPINVSETNVSSTANLCAVSYSNYGGSYYNASILNSTYYDWFNINISHTNSKLLLDMSSDSNLYIALFTASQYNQWLQNANYIPSNVSFLKYTSFVYQNISVPIGNWYFIAWNNESYGINLNYDNFYIYYPYISPFSYHFISYNQTNSSIPAPTGLASYGLMKYGNSISPYCIKTNALLGLASINNISSVYLAPIKNISSGSASLQLNGMLVVNNANSNTFNYWIQNTLSIDTNFNDYSSSIDIFNETGPVNSNFTNLSIQGNGQVYQDNGYTDFRQETPYSYYNLPLNRVIMTKSYVKSGSGIWLYFYDLPMNIGSPISLSQFNNQSAYAKIFIYDPYATSAYFLVSGYQRLHNSAYYDAELTFGGGANGENSYFYNTTSAAISLLYFNQSTDNFMEFPSYYAFGSDTAEGSYNLNVTKTSFPLWAIANVGWINSTPSLGYLS